MLGFSDVIHAFGRLDPPGLILIGIVLVVAIKGVSNVLMNASRERTRREIAAYIAEGSMSAEAGERLMAARSKGDCDSAV
ncbi:MAG: hypothetical protein AB8G96_11395 [Phycisphaerales bacterium]